jgi:hypothetical protein
LLVAIQALPGADPARVGQRLQVAADRGLRAAAGSAQLDTVSSRPIEQQQAGRLRAGPTAPREVIVRIAGGEATIR